MPETPRIEWLRPPARRLGWKRKMAQLKRVMAQLPLPLKEAPDDLS